MLFQDSGLPLSTHVYRRIVPVRGVYFNFIMNYAPLTGAIFWKEHKHGGELLCFNMSSLQDFYLVKSVDL